MHTPFDVKLHAFFFQHPALAGYFGSIGLTIEAIKRTIRGHDTMAGDFRSKGVMPQGLTDCLRRKTVDLFGHYGVCCHPSFGYSPCRIIDALLERRDGWHVGLFEAVAHYRKGEQAGSKTAADQKGSLSHADYNVLEEAIVVFMCFHNTRLSLHFAQCKGNSSGKSLIDFGLTSCEGCFIA